MVKVLVLQHNYCYGGGGSGYCGIDGCGGENGANGSDTEIYGVRTNGNGYAKISW